MRGARIGMAAASCLGIGAWLRLDRVPAEARAPAPPAAIPVAVAEARLRDVPVYLQGLGNVQAFSHFRAGPQLSPYR